MDIRTDNINGKPVCIKLRFIWLVYRYMYLFVYWQWFMPILLTRHVVFMCETTREKKTLKIWRKNSRAALGRTFCLICATSETEICARRIEIETDEYEPTALNTNYTVLWTKQNRYHHYTEIVLDNIKIVIVITYKS